MKRFAILLCVLALPAWGQEPAAGEPQAPEDWEQLGLKAKDMRAEAKRMREEAAQTHAAAEKACWDKFLVSDCLHDAKQAQRAAEREAKALEVEAGRIERRIDAHKREEKAARRAADAPRRAAEIARRAEAIRLKEQKARQHQEEKAAEIEKRQSGKVKD